MKTRAAVLVSGIILAGILAAGGQKGQKSAWKGKVETENGVTIIRNPAEPLYGELRLDLEEDLQIGREDDENYIFGQIFDIQVDEAGSVYVCDVKARSVQKYDKTGRYLRTIGKNGQGPGEYDRPMGLFWLRGPGTLYIRDMLRIKAFQPSGEYAGETLLRGFPYSFAVDGDGNIWAAVSMAADEGRFKALEKISPKGEPLKSLGRFAYDIYTRRPSAETTVSVSTGFEHDLHLAKLEDRAFVFGYSKKYELDVVDIDGSLLFKIRNDEPARRIPGDAQKAMAQYIPVDSQPFFYGLTVDDAGRLWVLRTNPLGARGQDKEFDVYGSDGRFLYKTHLRYGRIFVLKNGCLYARHVFEDEGLEVVKRYIIKNWGALRSAAE